MELNADLLVLVAVTIGIFLLAAFPVHEFFHAFAAYKLGDNTARYMGRLTLDPRVHFDRIGGSLLAISGLVGALAGQFFAFGYAKPTPVNPINLDGGRRSEAIVAAAGPLSNLVMAAVVAIVLRIIGTSDLMDDVIRTNPITAFAWDVGFLFVYLNVILFIFNLLPIPPLDGWHVLLALVSPRTAYTLRSYEQYAFFGLLLIILFGGRIIGPFVAGIVDVLMGGAPGLIPYRVA